MRILVGSVLIGIATGLTRSFWLNVLLGEITGLVSLFVVPMMWARWRRPCVR